MLFILKAIIADLGLSFEKFLLDVNVSFENLSFILTLIFGKIFNNKGLIVKEPKNIVSNEPLLFSRCSVNI